MNNDLTTGNISRTLLKLSIPILGSMFLSTIFNVVDAMWVGRSSVLALASVNTASFTLWIMMAVAGIITTGANSLIASKVGESIKRPQAAGEAVHIAQLSIFLSILMGFAELAIVVIWGENILNLITGSRAESAAMVKVGCSYLGTLALFAPAICLNDVFSSILRAYGDTKTPLKLYSIGFLLNFILDPLFIFGWGPVPAMGAFGAAAASDISFGAVFFLFVMKITRPGLAFTLPKSRPETIEWKYAWKMAAIGTPVSLASIVFSSVYMAIMPVISSFGQEAVAALGIGHRMESFNYAICSGISLACITMIGQNLGAGNIKRASQAAWTAISWACIINVFVSASFWLIPEWYVSFFGNDEGVKACAVSYLQIIAYSQLFSGVCVIVEGVFAGGGRTIPPMCVSIPCSLLRIPACYYLIFTAGCGITAVWWTLSLLTILRAILIFALFVMGFWFSRKTLHAAAAAA